MKLHAPGGGKVFIGPHMLLPADKARHVGEAVAMVVAETKNQALDAAEAVEVDYEELPFVIHSEDAIKPGAPAVWDELPSNMPVETFFGDRDATDKAFAAADHVVKLDLHIGRVTGVPIEPRAAVANYDKATGRYTLYAGSGGAVRQKHELATVLGIKPDDLRVLSYDVGGNFGTRNRVFVEFGLVLWASKKLGRPVKYTATRSEAFLTDYQGRDLVTKVELALRKDGKFLAMRATNISNIGARAVSFSPLSKGLGPDPRLLRHSGGDAARGRDLHQHHADAGLSLVRPAGGDLRHRAADRQRRDRARHRPRRAPPQEPDQAEGDAVSQRRRHALRLRPLRREHGLGDGDRRLEGLQRSASARPRSAASCSASGSATTWSPRSARRRSRPRSTCGRRAASTWSSARSRAGRGTRRASRRWSSDLIQVPVEKVKIILGDTDVVKVGGGSHSGRSMRHAATVFSKAAVDLIDKGKKIAALAMDVPADSIEFSDDGRFTSRDTNRSFDFLELAKRGRAASQLPDELKERPLDRHRQRDARAGVSQRHRDLRGRGRSRHRRASTSRAMPRSTTSAAASIR